MSGVSRRELLAGSAGLVVGGGAAGGIVAGTTGSGAPASGPDVASPGEALMTEHGVLKRVLLAYRATADRLASGRVGTGVVVDAAQIIAQYVESFHEGLEEAYVFPRVRRAEPDLVRTLLVQHDRGRHLTARIVAAGPDVAKSAAARAQVRADMLAFVHMYEPHEAWEDTVVFPTLRRLTPQRTLDELAERFAQLENRQFGHHSLAQILDRVHGVEQQLGIADLDAFTPTL